MDMIARTDATLSHQARFYIFPAFQILPEIKAYLFCMVLRATVSGG